MGKNTSIGWTDHTYNALWGCSKVSAGCTNCYAETFSKRVGQSIWGDGPRREFGEKHWNEPLTWNSKAERDGVRRRVFCGSMFDWCEEHPQVIASVPRIHELWRRTPQLDWLMLTKRANRIAQSLPADWNDGYPNVWLGTSIEDMRVADRADDLRVIPAVVRFISHEPALGPLGQLKFDGIDWVITGAESGPKFRPMDQSIPREVRDICQSQGIAFYFKQNAARFPGTNPFIDGILYRQFPTPRTVERCLHSASS